MEHARVQCGSWQCSAGCWSVLSEGSVDTGDTAGHCWQGLETWLGVDLLRGGRGGKVTGWMQSSKLQERVAGDADWLARLRGRGREGWSVEDHSWVCSESPACWELMKSGTLTRNCFSSCINIHSTCEIPNERAWHLLSQ